ncbi:MAG: DUF4834 family protein [Bacteroidota bacterium]|nr:DUF4834 family protein [Bacteroidota bacterium]MDX5431532.1 DUF4834 family protein [Bacteroidota bacterium]MDX5470253.1 DUF4834 family protein [Bacteroidota bacterium]
MKALLYLVLIYFAYKLYKAFSQARVIVKQYHYHDNRQFHKEEEGKVTIKENPADKAGSQKSLDHEGDYVDFEEVKD